MDERDSMQSFFSVTNGFVNAFSIGVTVLHKNVIQEPGAGNSTGANFKDICSSFSRGNRWPYWGSSPRDNPRCIQFSTSTRAAVDDTQTAMFAGGLVGAMSEIPVYLRDKAGATLTGRSQGMHMMRRRPLFLTKAIVGAHIGGFLYFVLRDDDPQGSSRFPQAPAQGNQEGQKLDTCNSSKSLDTTGDWATAKPSCGEFLEGEDLH